LGSLDVSIVPYVQAYQKFKDEKGFVPKLIEHYFLNKDYKYAGTLDRTGE